MATAVQFRRGNTQQTSAFTGLVGEVTVDTDKEVVVVHDGVTAGGFPGARESVVITVSNKTDSAYNKANSANVLAQTGFNQANTAYDQANTAFNKANSANVLAQSAYNQANTGTTIGQGGFDKANSANVLAQTAYDQANTGTTIAQAGFNKANSANVLAQQAYDQANTGTTIAQAGFDKANSANVLAQSAYDQANTGTTIAQAGFNKANSANVLAQQAYDQANTGTTIAQSAYNQANTGSTTGQAGFDKANSANVLAQQAYDFANTRYSANGGTISGDVAITGNLVVDKTTNVNVIYANTVYDSNKRVVSDFSNTAPILVTKEASSNTISISHKTSGVVASGYGDSISIPAFVVDTTGHVTSVTNTTIRSSSTSQTGVVQLEDSYTSTSTTTAATPNSVKIAFDQANSAYAQANAANTLADSKFAKTGGIITGNVQIQGNLVISGNVTTISANNLTIQDNMLYLNDGLANANPDLGLVAAYDDGTYQHTGIFRDATDGYWTIFDNYTLEPEASIYIDTSHASYRVGNFRANIATNVISVRGFDPLDRANNAYDKANSANVLAQAAYDKANAANTLAQAGYDQANTGTTIAQAGFNKANSANVLAQSAYDQANTGTTIAQAAFDKANTGNTTAQSAYNQANTGTTVAQAGYNQANTGTTIAQAGYNQANTANSIAANSVQTTGSTMTGTLTVPTLTANGSVTINTNMYLSSTTHTLPTGGISGSVDSWSTTSYRSAKYIAQMTYGSSYHMLEVSVIHDGTQVYISQFGEVKTGSSLGTFDGLISGGTFSLLCTAGGNGTVVKLAKTLIPV
jgi:hypothetical protein